MSRATRELLTAASIIRGRFDLELLTAVLDVAPPDAPQSNSENKILDALDEALRAGVIR